MPIDPQSLDAEGWQHGTVTWRKVWPGAKGLVSLRLSGEVTPRQAGQYVKLACANSSGDWGVRYLSLSSAPDAPPEVLVAPVSGDREPGNPAALRVGDAVIFSRVGNGKLVVPTSGQTLWLFAAGTGLAPLLSVLRAGNTGFERVVLVHSTRFEAQLAWAEELAERQKNGELTYVPLVTRPGGDHDQRCPRIPTLLTSGQLAERAKIGLDVEQDAAMLCGSGDMIGETRAALEELGMAAERIITEF